MATYTLKLYQLDGTTVVNADVKFRDLECRWVLNSPGAIEVTLPFDTTSYSEWTPGAREIRLERDGTRIFGGYVWAVSGSSQDRESVAARGLGYFSALRSRLVTSDLIYADTNQHQIAWNLINHTQGQANGALGFTQGAHTGSSRARDRGYCANERPNVGDAISDLAAFDDGFDYEISPTKVFNTWSPTRGASSGITFTGTNEVVLDWEEDATEALSYVTAIGNDDCNPYVAEVSDGAAISTYNRLHGVVELSDTDRKREVTAKANETLRQRKRGMFRARVSFDDEFGPAWGTYEVGDTVVVNVAEKFATFNRTLKIVERVVSLEDPDKAYVELVLDAAT